MREEIKVIILLVCLAIGYPLTVFGIIISFLEWDITGTIGRGIILGVILILIGTYIKD